MTTRLPQQLTGAEETKDRMALVPADIPIGTSFSTPISDYFWDGSAWQDKNNNPEFTSTSRPSASSFGKGQAWISDTGSVSYSDGGEWYVTSSNSSIVDLRNYITDFTGATDQSTQLSEAESYAYTNNLSLFHPGGTILSGYIQFRIPVVGVSSGVMNSLGIRSIFKSTVTDGTTAFRFKNTSTVFYSENIIFLGSGRAGLGAAQNAIGVSVGEYEAYPPETDSQRRGSLKNILVKNWKTGCVLQGWLNEYQNFWITDCEVGAKIDQANGCILDMIFENNLQDFQMVTSFGSVFPRLQQEGAYGNAASTIDGCKGIQVASFYGEQPGRDVPYIIIGGTTACYNIEFPAGIVNSCGDGVSPIEFDRVTGFPCNLYFQTDTDRTSYSTTINSKQQTIKIPNIESGFPSTTLTLENNFNQPYAVNLFPNPTMDGLNGTRFAAYNVDVAGGSRATIGRDTNNYLTGRQSLKVQGVNGQSDNYMGIRIRNSDLLDSIQSRPLTIGAWVFIPNIAGMDPSTANYRAPAIGISSWLSGTKNSGVNSSQITYYKIGQWNFISTYVPTIANSIDELYIQIWVNNTANNSVTGDYILVDSLFLATGYCATAIYEGRIIDSPVIPAQLANGKMRIRDVQAFFSTTNRYAQDSDQYWEVGDIVEYTDPAPGGYIGKICTTGGAGSASVWKEYGAILA